MITRRCTTLALGLSLTALVAPVVVSAQVDGPTPERGANGEQTWPRTGPNPKHEPLETGTKNVPEFQPAFTQQTRAPGVESKVALQVSSVADGLEWPWALALLPDGRMLVTEKLSGRLMLLASDGGKSALAGMPRVDAREQGGLMDVSPAPDFARSQRVYFSYYEPRKGGNGLAVAHARLNVDKRRVEGLKVIFRMQPTLASHRHAGGRLVWADGGQALFVTLGDRYLKEGRVQAQDLRSHLGKVVRIRPDGGALQDNPFVGQKGARAEIWTRGHRNVLGADLDAQGRLWIVEMGPRGGDELNLIERGQDYGWPTIGYGEEYSGASIHAATQASGLTQPVYYWDPVISPSSLVIYQGALFPAWKGNFFIGGLSSHALVRLVLEGDRVVGEERLLTDLHARIRDVTEGPDGALYVLTDEASGRLLKLTPKP